jgi:hypothetical protein
MRREIYSPAAKKAAGLFCGHVEMPLAANATLDKFIFLAHRVIEWVDC